MATPEPFEGAPDRVPGQEGIAPIQSGANPASFGVGLAQAVGHLGEIVEGSGKELFDRAYAMQELQVHADVNARLADAQNGMMNKYVEFSNLEGKNAVDGLPKFQQDIDGIREKGGDGLSPVGQEFYDQESRQSRYRLSFAGASHAAQQQKAYAMGSADASAESSMKMMEVDPNNPATTEAALENIRAQVAHKYGDLGGMSSEEVKIKQSDAVNTALQGRIRALAKTDPLGAQKLLNQGISKGEVYGNDATNLGWFVKNQAYTIGARQTGHAVMSGAAGMDLDAKKVSPEQLLAGLKGSEGGSYSFVGPDVTDKSGNTGHATGHFGVMSYNLAPWLKEAGMAPMTEAQFLASPDTQDKLAMFKMSQYQDKFGSAHAAAVAWFGGEGSVGSDLSKLHDKNMDGNTYLRNFDGGVAHGSSLEQLTNAGKAVAETQFPDDPEYHDRVTDGIITQYNKEKAIQRDTDFNNEQTIYSTLLQGVGPDHKIPTSVDELKLDPKAADAWDQLANQHPSELKKYLNQMATNAKGDVAMTPQRLQSWQQLSGQAINDPQGFMSKTSDVSSLDLPMKEKLAVINMRGQIYKKQDANPQVSHAMSVIGRLNMLGPLGINKTDNPEALATFTGVLADAMTQFQQANQKPMSDDDIKTTAQQLLSPVGGGGWLHPFGGGKTPWFQSIDEVPPEIEESIRQDFASKGITPDDSAILGAYLAAQYHDLFGKSKAAVK